MEASVILVIYNGIKYLPNCLDSLAADLHRGCEVIVIDNASTDGSCAYIKENYPQFICIRNEANTGFAAACNQGANLAQGDFLVFLNQDTRVCPGWLGGLLEPFSLDITIGLTTSKLLLMSRPGQINMCGQDIHFSGFTFARGLFEPADRWNQGEMISAVSGASFAIRRELWRKLGGFDERYFMYYEETDLSWKAWLAGYACYYSPGSEVYHDYGLKSSPAALYYSARNRWVLLLKHWRVPTLLLLAPGLILAELVEWVLMLFIGRQGLSAKLRAVGWVGKNMPSILRSRRVSLACHLKPNWFLLRRCSSQMTPKIMASGLFGKILLMPLNFLFGFNFIAAETLVRWLNI